MSSSLPPLVASYVQFMNAGDSETFAALFTPHATVRDEGHEHCGTAAIKAWLEDVHKKYQPTLEVTGLTDRGGETVVTGLVSGTFDGSPLELHHYLTITDGKIVALTIKA